ncbi:hypothetical protein GC102_22895 [Paenibacillus sp. LMG 31460]|uniref:5-bromo-4-chloroindolyl phosphate hydrolysis protein n=1 Tax=Paenibacillus germinis TaxID=2654979 RepID=A0ABX1Z5Q9_9BACL|nr:hypothetical protein [Paenibacillus germinis]NOU88578.1 hypothetical protein [Paenibacillus germinis]
MLSKNHLKLVVIILGVVVFNIAVLSPGIIGIEIGGSALETASGVTIIFASILALSYATNMLIFKLPSVKPVKEIRTHNEYIDALTHYKGVKTLQSDIGLALRQLERLRKRMETLLGLLNQRFDPNELTYKKFTSVAQEVENLFYLNIRSILGRMHVFDENEYKIVMLKGSSRLPSDLIAEKTMVYNEFLSFVKDSLGTNEEILLKIDKLLMEISRLDSLELADIEQMPCMQEIDSLIKQTIHYKE